MIEIDFVVKGYPGSGRRVEDDRDLAIVNRPELVQGAFMGDMLLKIDSADFSTKFGWLTMIDLCLRLSVSVSDLANMTFRRFQLPESDDYVSFQRDGQNVVVSCSYAEGTAAVLYDDLRAAVREFVDGCLERIAREYPLALRNPAMVDVYSRLGRPFREPGGPQTSSVVN